MKKLVCLALCFLFILTGCGSSAADSATATNDTAQNETETSEATESIPENTSSDLSNISSEEDASAADTQDISVETPAPAPTLKKIKAKYDGDTEKGTWLNEKNDGITVTAYYDDGTNEIVTNDEINIPKPKKLKAAKKTKIKILYQNKACALTVKCTSLTASQFKSKCKSIPYKNIARRPEKYRNKKIVFTGEVLQVISEEDGITTLLVFTKKSYFGYSDDLIHVVYYSGKKNESRILEDDIITFWGTSQGLYSYETTNGNSNTIPEMYAYYYKLH